MLGNCGIFLFGKVIIDKRKIYGQQWEQFDECW